MYVTDYLGSVRAVVDGRTGELYKAVDYSAYGEETVVEAASVSGGLTLRDGYTGKENQHPDFGTSYTDFGARQYHPTLHRWMTPDPLSEKYYGISPYAFCNNDPVNFVDLDGMDWIKNGKNGNYEWQDNVTAASDTPEGYSYIGKSSTNILDDLNINSKYVTQETRVSYIAGENDTNSSVLLKMAFKLTCNMTVSAAISYDDANSSSNNLLGKTFEGVYFNVSVTQKSIDSQNQFAHNAGASLEINYGGKLFSTLLKEPTYAYVTESGTDVISGNVLIPACLISETSTFGRMKLNLGINSRPMYGKSSEVEWEIMKSAVLKAK